METDQVRTQLDRMLSSTAFAGADRSSRFLRFVIDRALEGRREEIKETVIAVEVLGRNPSFDPKTDPIVRVEAGRLRTRLSFPCFFPDGQHFLFLAVSPSRRIVDSTRLPP